MNKEELIKYIVDNAESIVFEKAMEELQNNNKYIFKGFFTVTREPRKKGENNGFGKGGNINYSKRLKYKASKKIKDLLCK